MQKNMETEQLSGISALYQKKEPFRLQKCNSGGIMIVHQWNANQKTVQM